MAAKKSGSVSLNATATLVAKPGDVNKKGLTMKRAKYEFESDDGTITGVLYAIVPKGTAPADTLAFAIQA